MSRSKRAIAGLTLCGFLAASMPAYADESLVLTPTPLVHEGRDGDWFPADQSEKMLLKLEHIGELEALVDKYEALKEAQDKAFDAAQKAESAAEKLAEREQKRADDYKALSEKQAEELASTWRQPWPWLLIGAGAAVLLLSLFGGGASVTVVK